MAVFPGRSSGKKAGEGMPTTRYQGSKRKVLPELYEVFSGLKFETCLDAFGGTGSVTHLLRRMGKRVTYNDVLPANAAIAKALFSPGPCGLDEEKLERLFVRRKNRKYRSFIEENYRGIYYLDRENRELDTLAQNIPDLKSEREKAEAYYVLFQSMLCKRPYNLFHRANLRMRTSDVKRSFGNKATWEKPFRELMHRFLTELREYRQAETGKPVTVRCGSAFHVKRRFDLVYIDTPYAKSGAVQESNYFNFYHFLDAVIEYRSLPSLIKSGSRNRAIYEINQSWHPGGDLMEAFTLLLSRFAPSQLVLSYRSDGYPAPAVIMRLLREFYKNPVMHSLAEYRYVLSTAKKGTEEMVFVCAGAK